MPKQSQLLNAARHMFFINNPRFRNGFLLFFIVLFCGLMIDLPGLWKNRDRGADSYAYVISTPHFDLWSENVVLGDARNRGKGTDSWMSDTYRPTFIEEEFKGKTNSYGMYVADSYDDMSKEFEHRIYLSNIVVQRFFIYFLDTVLGLDRALVLTIAFTINCTLMAACSAVIFFWLSKRVGVIPMLALAVLACLGGTGYTIGAKSLYWQTWTMYAPMALTCIFCDGYLSRFRLFRGNGMWLAWMFVLLSLKLSCYFEFMTTAIIAAFIPQVLHAMEKGLLWRWSFVKLCVSFALVVIGSFLLVMSAKLAVSAHDLGGLRNAVSYTLQNIHMRTLEPHKLVPEKYFSIFGKLHAVLACFQYECFRFPRLVDIQLTCGLLFLVFGSLPLLFTKLRKLFSACTKRLIATQWCAFLALTSWWVLATPHAVIHCNYCVILQWIPFCLLVWASAFAMLRDLLHHPIEAKGA